MVGVSDMKYEENNIGSNIFTNSKNTWLYFWWK